MIAAHDPSLVAVSKRTGQVLAAGADARRMLDHTQADIILMPRLQASQHHPRPRPEVAKRPSRSPGLFLTLCAAMLLLTMLSHQAWASGAVGAMKSALAPWQAAVTNFGGQVDRVTSVFGDVAALRAENQRLRDADEQLRRQVIELGVAARENASLRQALDLERSSGFRMEAAQVVGRGPDGLSHTLEVDRGTADGVKVGMVVVTGAGLLGRIEEAGPHSAIVQTLADPRIQLEVVLVNSNLQATLKGGASQMRIDIPNPSRVALSTGDWVLTSDVGKTYPPGLLVGEVVNVTRGAGSTADSAVLAWVNDPARTTFVLVITDFVPS
jgi:rod shape-determining protein MreC